MERFFGGNPALVLIRLAILSLVVGVILAALGFSPFDLLDSVRRLAARIYDMGFAAIEKSLRYFLLGAVMRDVGTLPGSQEATVIWRRLDRADADSIPARRAGSRPRQRARHAHLLEGGASLADRLRQIVDGGLIEMMAGLVFAGTQMLHRQGPDATQRRRDGRRDFFLHHARDRLSQQRRQAPPQSPLARLFTRATIGA